MYKNHLASGKYKSKPGVHLCSHYHDIVRKSENKNVVKQSWSCPKLMVGMSNGAVALGKNVQFLKKQNCFLDSPSNLTPTCLPRRN